MLNNTEEPEDSVKENDIEDWSSDPPDTPIFYTEKDKVTDYDIFKLAKIILLWSAIIFIILAILRCFFSTEGVKEVWDFSKVVLNSIVSLVLGLYFGSNQKK